MIPRNASAAAALAMFAGLAPGQSTDPFPAQFQLSGLLPANSGDGSDGFVLNGINAFDYSGTSVSSAGDVNGDGFDDLIIGAYAASPNGQFSAGESYVVFGAPGLGTGGELELSSLNGLNGFALRGRDSLDSSGFSVSAAGDVNGDGFDDLIIGADLADPNGIDQTGESYLVFGAAGVGAGGVLDLASLHGTDGFALTGIDTDDRCGFSVSSAGDLNADGFDDLIVGAPSADPSGISYAGESYVVFGASDLGSGGVGTGGSFAFASLNGTNGFVLSGIGTLDLSGASVAQAGDVNGDGFDDLIIGARYADPNGIDQTGGCYVVFGASGLGVGGSFELASLTGPNGFVLNGIDATDWCGDSVASAGDVNGDGFDDLIIGARYADPNGIDRAGECYLLFGASDLGSGGVGTGGSFELSSLTGPDGFVLNGIDTNDRSGTSVASAGDLNGDGLDDLILGANYADPNGNLSSGESYVVFGASDLGSGGVGTGGTFELSSLTGPDGFVLNGIDTNDRCGISVSSAGDVNADGIDDLIVGASGADPNGEFSAGESYVVFGRDLAVPPCPADTNGDGILDNGDINAFIALFLGGDPTADFNADGFLDNGDIIAFINAFLAGC